MSTFAQNNGVIALTRCASRTAGYACCFWLILAGILSKFAAALVSIPSPVLGGMTTFLFGSVAVSGVRIISAGVPFTRRNRFILTASLCIGFGAILVPNWFSYVFTYAGDNRGIQGLCNAVVLVMETSFAVTALLAVVLNLLLKEEVVDEETQELTANIVQLELDNAEWDRVTHKSGAGGVDGQGDELAVTREGVKVVDRKGSTGKGFQQVQVGRESGSVV